MSPGPATAGRPIVALVAVVSALGAVAAHPQPTAAGGSDVVVALVVGALAVAISATASPKAWLTAAAALLAATTGAAAGLAAAAAIPAGLALWRPDRYRRPAAGALVGAIVVQAVLRLPTDHLFRNAVVALLGLGVLAVSGWTHLPPARRAAARPIARALGAVAGTALAAFVVAALCARADLGRGVSRAQDGVDEARLGNSDQAAALLDQAQSSFGSAHDRLDAWWAKPALALPIVGQHLRALTVMSGAGSNVTGAAAAAARSAQIEDLQVVDGRLDLDRVRATAAPLASARAALAEAAQTSAAAHSPWLVGPVASRIRQFDRDVQAAAADARTAADAVDVLPDILGGSGIRYYFVVFGTPAETRELGGFMGAYAILQAEDGELSLTRTGRVRDLNFLSRQRTIADRAALPDHLLALQPERFWQNITGTADFPTVADLLDQMWPPGAEVQPDGVIYMDPMTLASLLELTGPITVPELDQPLTADTAGPFLLRDQYVEFPDDNRHDFLVEAAETVFTKLTSGELPAPRVIADTLGSPVRERRLLIHSFRPAEQAVFERLHLDGGLGAVHGDFLSVRASNRGLSKIDAMMQRTVTYDVTVDPANRTVHATATVTIRNDAPSSGLPYVVIGNHLGQPSGTNSTTLAVYTPLELVEVSQDGEPINRGASDDYGRFRYTALVDVPPGEEVTVVFELQGRIDLDGGYHLDVVPQPLVNPDHLRVIVHGTDGWIPRAGSGLTTELSEAQHLDVAFREFG